MIDLFIDEAGILCYANIRYKGYASIVYRGGHNKVDPARIWSFVNLREKAYNLISISKHIMMWPKLGT